MTLPQEPHQYCHACGSRYENAVNWPRKCHRCETISWGNPKPCAIVLQPVVVSYGTRSRIGLLTIERRIAPCIGERALPGGYIDHRENAYEAAARELREETGISREPEAFRMFRTASSTDKDILIVFCCAPTCTESQVDMSFESKETGALGVIQRPERLAFDSHTESALLWFNDTMR